MSYSIKYKELFSVKILHQYFLDKGSVKFSMMTEADRLKQLKDYDFRSVINIFPTAKTFQQLNGHKLIFKTHNTGFTVWCRVSELDNKEPFIASDENLFFTFVIQLKDSLFYNYTDLTFQSAGKPYYLSNRNLAAEPNSFPLIDSAGGNNHVGESFIQSAEFDERDGLEKLTISEKINLMGLIRIYMKGDENSMSVTTIQHKLRVSPRKFEVAFKNRHTFWRYLYNRNQSVTATDDLKIENGNTKQLLTKIEYPLTQKGFVSIKLDGKELPNPNVRNVKSDASNKYYSEVYL